MKYTSPIVDNTFLRNEKCFTLKRHLHRKDIYKKPTTMPQPTPIISACEFGRKDDVQRLIENGVNINALGFNEDLHDRTALMAALEFGEVEIALLLLGRIQGHRCLVLNMNLQM